MFPHSPDNSISAAVEKLINAFTRMHGGSKESHNLSLGACVSLSISLRYNPVGCDSGAAAGEHACIGVGVASLRDKLNQKVTERSNNGIAGSI